MHIGTIKILASIYFFPRGEISPDSTQINIFLQGTDIKKVLYPILGNRRAPRRHVTREDKHKELPPEEADERKPDDVYNIMDN